LNGYTAVAVCLAAASLGFAAAASASGRLTIVVLCMSIVVLTVGEVTQVGSAWALSFAIAPAADRNAYLVAFSTGRAAGRACGPLLLTGVVLTAGAAGWVGLAVLFLAASAAPIITASQHTSKPAIR
jgi:hypothetical protein